MVRPLDDGTWRSYGAGREGPWGAFFGMCVARFGTSWMVDAGLSLEELRERDGELADDDSTPGRCFTGARVAADRRARAAGAGARLSLAAARRVIYLLRGDRVELLGDAEPSGRASIVESFTKDRHPILSFGGNGSPEWLTTKFAHFWEEENKEVLVLTGELHDVDVGASASPSPLGYMPGTLFASPGTAVRAAMVWCTADQLTQLTWSEVPYQLGRLEDALFVMDEADVEVEHAGGGAGEEPHGDSADAGGAA